MATYDWTILTLERDILPEDMDGAVVIAHWQCVASQDTHTSSAYGTAGFTPDPSAPGYVAYEDLTEAEVLAWCWADGVDKDSIEANLQGQIDALITPTTADGVPWVSEDEDEGEVE